jgi:hypothetical protein
VTSGANNTSNGTGSLQSNSTGSNNTAMGQAALFSSNSEDNVAIGSDALSAFVSSGDGSCRNIAIGRAAMQTTTSAYQTIVIGAYALYNDGGTGNTFIGYAASNQGAGDYNTSLGWSTLSEPSTGYTFTGSYNIALGQLSGSQYRSNESSNILIGHIGVVGESNVLRIGTQGSGNGQLNECFVAGIVGNTLTNGSPVYIDSNGQLGDGSTTPISITLTGDQGSTRSKFSPDKVRIQMEQHFILEQMVVIF